MEAALLPRQGPRAAEAVGRRQAVAAVEAAPHPLLALTPAHHQPALHPHHLRAVAAAAAQQEVAEAPVEAEAEKADAD